MDIAKNMEAIFFVAIALISATGFANASSQAVAAGPAAVQFKMQVVTISAKRLTATEKAALPQ